MEHDCLAGKSVFCFKTSTYLKILLCLHIPGTTEGSLKWYVPPKPLLFWRGCFCCQRILLS